MSRRPVTDLMGYVRERIEVSPEGCWVWTAGKMSDGYGSIQLKNWRGGAHRVVYEELVGPIPEGLQLDHLCRNVACCNPDHLEPVTQQENLRRGHYATKGRNYGLCFDKANGVWVASVALPRGEGGRRRAKTFSSKDRSTAAKKAGSYLAERQESNGAG